MDLLAVHLTSAPSGVGVAVSSAAKIALAFVRYCLPSTLMFGMMRRRGTFFGLLYWMKTVMGVPLAFRGRSGRSQSGLQSRRSRPSRTARRTPPRPSSRSRSAPVHREGAGGTGPFRFDPDSDQQFVGEGNVVGDVFVCDDTLVNRFPHRHLTAGSHFCWWV